MLKENMDLNQCQIMHAQNTKSLNHKQLKTVSVTSRLMCYSINFTVWDTEHYVFLYFYLFLFLYSIMTRFIIMFYWHQYMKSAALLCILTI